MLGNWGLLCLVVTGVLSSVGAVLGVYTRVNQQSSDTLY
jgi:hypothetical protein